MHHVFSVICLVSITEDAFQPRRSPLTYQQNEECASVTQCFGSVFRVRQIDAAYNIGN